LTLSARSGSRDSGDGTKNGAFRLRTKNGIASNQARSFTSKTAKRIASKKATRQGGKAAIKCWPKTGES
jgi:hypothetical protein